ncbi:DNA polymerase IV, partial [Achromobacter anxifer]
MIELRKIVHVDMDAFYASVEQRDNPDLRGKPVVVAWTGPRSVVCAASYEARRFGIHSAMSAARAERLCPHAIYIPPDFNRYREVSRQVRQIFARHTDMIEPLSLDEAYLDVTVNKLGLPSATEVAQVIRQQIREETGLTASAGVAPNKFLAKIASDWNKPDGLFVVRPAKVLAFLEPLPVRKVPGVGKVTQARLEQLGIHTVGDLATHSAQELEHYFGRYGRRLYELARGIDEREVQTDQPLQQVSSETTFSRDVRLDSVGEALDRMAEKVWDQALKKGALGRTVVLKLKTDRFRILTRSQTS